MYRRFKEWLERREEVRKPIPTQQLTIGNNTLHLRRMEMEDIPAALDLERAVYGDTPWERVAFMSELQKTSSALYLVLTDPVTEYLVAFIGTSFKRTEAHITNIAVAPDFQHQGIGRSLMNLMLARARTMGMSVMSLEVRTDNVHAQALYRSLGFTDGRVRRNYYTRERADALDMSVRLDGRNADANCERNVTE
jgi:ribosomal-protein-alanine N-acetyltransferase